MPLFNTIGVHTLPCLGLNSRRYTRHLEWRPFHAVSSRCFALWYHEFITLWTSWWATGSVALYSGLNSHFFRELTSWIHYIRDPIQISMCNAFFHVGYGSALQLHCWCYTTNGRTACRTFLAIAHFTLALCWVPCEYTCEETKEMKV